MLTKNFYNHVMSYLTGNTIVGGAVDTNGTVYDMYDAEKITYDWSYMKTLTLSNYFGNYSAGAGVRIGNGVTPATADDYTLESIITNDRLVIGNPGSVLVTKEKDFVAVYAVYTIANNGTESQSISEIGLFTGMKTGSSSTNITLGLMDRTVLESPITINPGEAKPITYTIRFNYPVE